MKKQNTVLLFRFRNRTKEFREFHETPKYYVSEDEKLEKEKIKPMTNKWDPFWHLATDKELQEYKQECKNRYLRDELALLEDILETLSDIEVIMHTKYVFFNEQQLKEDLSKSINRLDKYIEDKYSMEGGE